MNIGDLIAENRRWVRLHKWSRYQREAAERMTQILDALAMAHSRAVKAEAAVERQANECFNHMVRREQERDAALAVTDKALDYLRSDPSIDMAEMTPGKILLDILSSVPDDVLRERDAEKWDEGWEACADDDYAGSLTVDQRPNPHRTGRQS